MSKYVQMNLFFWLDLNPFFQFLFKHFPFHQRCLPALRNWHEHQDFIYQFSDSGWIFLEFDVFLGGSRHLPERLCEFIFPLVTYFRHRPCPKIPFSVLPKSHMECSHFATSLMASQLTPPQEIAGLMIRAEFPLIRPYCWWKKSCTTWNVFGTLWIMVDKLPILTG